VRICANFGAQISRGIPRDLTRQCANWPPVAASSWAFRRSIGHRARARRTDLTGARPRLSRSAGQSPRCPAGSAPVRTRDRGTVRTLACCDDRVRSGDGTPGRGHPPRDRCLRSRADRRSGGNHSRNRALRPASRDGGGGDAELRPPRCDHELAVPSRSSISEPSPIRAANAHPSSASCKIEP
jgi:hypothetical protein